VVNGTQTPAADEPTPALADTSQWSWETANPTPVVEAEPTPETPPAAEPVTDEQAPKPTAERARDDLQPPY
jgi:hypothetical protein